MRCIVLQNHGNKFMNSQNFIGHIQLPNNEFILNPDRYQVAPSFFGEVHGFVR